MQNRIFEEQDIFMKRKPTKYTRELVLDFLNDQSSDFGVATQFELQEKLEAYIAKNQEKYDVVPDQPDISRALTLAMSKTYEKQKRTYAFVKKGKHYFFTSKETILTELFKLEYLKETVHRLSDNTLVFDLKRNNHEEFIDIVEKKISPNMLWGNYSQENYLFLMFDVQRGDFKVNFEAFANFFKRKRAYESYLNLTRR